MEPLIRHYETGLTMEMSGAGGFSAYEPSVLLGRSLNSVEGRYAPKMLFASGPMRIPLPRPRVAIVGSRDASEESLRDAERIVQTLLQNNSVIVSGLARGIDSAAHRAAIRGGGQTIAVIGTPLDRAYPADNKQLQEEIRQNHLLVSQFAVGSQVSKSNFIQRNRTMALISDASIIIQAGESSGALSQGWEALRLNRPLFIWHRIYEKGFSWLSDMEEYGAMKLMSPKQVLEHLPSSRSVIEINV